MTSTPTTGETLRHACRDLGLGETVADALTVRLLAVPTGTGSTGIDPATHEAMLRREAEMMRLLNTHSPEKLIHDLRNVLNEVTLLKAAADL